MQSTRTSPPGRVLATHRFFAELETVRSVVQATMVDLGAVLPDAARRGEAELVLAEILNNVVEHAYRGLPKGIVQLTAMPCQIGIRFVIADSGLAMPNAAIPDGAAADLGCAPTDLPEGGFGWTIIRQLVEDLQYCREDGVNYTSFQIVT